MQILLPVGLIVVLCIVLVVPMVAMGKSPHVRYDASEISTSLDDVVGLGPVKEEVVKTLNLFLGYQTFRKVMGGNPRKGVLFEGPPGTGKTYMAKAMAHEAGVPFLFVSSTAFQSQYYGATGRKIRNYFKELRKAAAEEGGAIGFIEEIDAIAGARSGMRAVPYDGTFSSDPHGRTIARNSSEGISGVVNELLIQMQSFDTPSSSHRFSGWWIDGLNRFLPTHRRIRKRAPEPSNVLIIAATNRAADLDPALLRPGRFDRSIHFDLPSRTRSTRDHRLLPRPQGARARARQRGTARRAGRDDVRLHAGDDRAHLRRRSRLGVARRPDGDELGRTSSRRR